MDCTVHFTEDESHFHPDHLSSWASCECGWKGDVYNGPDLTVCQQQSKVHSVESGHNPRISSEWTRSYA